MLWWDEGVEWLSLHTRKQKANNTSPSSFLVTCSVPFSSNSPFQDTENVLRVAEALNAQVADTAAQRHTRFSKWETTECFELIPCYLLAPWLVDWRNVRHHATSKGTPEALSWTLRDHILYLQVKTKHNFPFQSVISKNMREVFI